AEVRIRRAYRLQKDHLDAAIGEIEDTLRARPQNPELMSYLAALYREKKNLKRSIELLEQLVVRFPDNARYQFTLGAVYDESGNMEQMAARMRRALELHPRNAPPLNYPGYSFAGLGTSREGGGSIVRRARAAHAHDSSAVH